MVISVSHFSDPWRVVICLLQPALDYKGLKVIERMEICQTGYLPLGLCYSDHRLFVCEWRSAGEYIPSSSLAVYSAHSDRRHITLLDRLELMNSFDLTPTTSPRVERHSRRVFVPIRSGVIVCRLHGDRLVLEKTLTCVGDAVSVDAMSPDTVYVCSLGENNSIVCIVDVREDRIMSTLDNPSLVPGYTPLKRPTYLAVLGDSVIVNYIEGYLAFYRHGSPAPVRVTQHPWRENMFHCNAVSTDYQHHFLVANTSLASVYVTDITGNPRHTVSINYSPKDVAVVNRQLWVLGGDNHISVMSSKWHVSLSTMTVWIWQLISNNHSPSTTVPCTLPHSLLVWFYCQMLVKNIWLFFTVSISKQWRIRHCWQTTKIFLEFPFYMCGFHHNHVLFVDSFHSDLSM